MRLIDANAFKQQVAAMGIKYNYDINKINVMFELIDKQPTAFDLKMNADEKALSEMRKEIQEYIDMQHESALEADRVGDYGELNRYDNRKIGAMAVYDFVKYYLMPVR